MMRDNRFGCLPTIIGSMPQTDPEAACAAIFRHLRDIPAWPQLPERSFLENMLVQYSEGFPGVVVEGERVYVDTSGDLTGALEAIYTAYLAGDIARFPVSRERAAGLYCFLEKAPKRPLAVKGHVTGPLTFGIALTDAEKNPIINHELLGDAVPKLLRLKAAWQENELRSISDRTIIFVDEPIMASAGSVAATGVLARPEKAVAIIDEVLSGISGTRGIHCCGNTDWSVILKTKLDVLSFDTYNYAPSLHLYADAVKRFLSNGGAIAWGIVPNSPGDLARESVASLRERLEEAIAPFTRNGIRFRDIVQQSLLTPSCSLIPLGEEGAERALEMLTGLSQEFRKRYG
ncbi:MAG: methionine synthase [Dehalococcoidales bacterium]|nr:methionine synthase [Dehalococcoidales bacterium]